MVMQDTKENVKIREVQNLNNVWVTRKLFFVLSRPDCVCIFIIDALPRNYHLAITPLHTALHGTIAY